MLVVVALAVVVLAPTATFAAWSDPIVQCSGALPDSSYGDIGNSKKACTVRDIAKTAQNLINTAIYISVFLSAGLFAWAGLIYVTNIANHGEMTKAKTIFTNVIIGLVILMASWLVIDTLMKTLVNPDASLGPWNQVC